MTLPNLQGLTLFTVSGKNVLWGNGRRERHPPFNSYDTVPSRHGPISPKKTRLVTFPTIKCRPVDSPISPVVRPKGPVSPDPPPIPDP